jgi:hypothetical protein
MPQVAVVVWIALMDVGLSVAAANAVMFVLKFIATTAAYLRPTGSLGQRAEIPRRTIAAPTRAASARSASSTRPAGFWSWRASSGLSQRRSASLAAVT